jgi:hypothetical protein
MILFYWMKEREARRRAMDHIKLRALLNTTLETALTVVYGDRRGLRVDHDGDLIGII